MFDAVNWLLVFVRASALLAIFPILSAPNFPIQLRLALAVLTAFLVAPTLAPINATHLSLIQWIGVMMVEVFIGLVFGFFSRMVFFAIDFAGNLIATEMGLNMSSDFNPLNSSRSETPGLILYYLAAMLFLNLDLHHWILAAFQKTYVLLPVGAARLEEPFLVELVAQTNRIFLVALQMAAPILAVSFLVSLMFAILGRAVPQMNVFTESFGFRTLAGLIVFGLTMSLMAQHIMNHLRQLPEDILRVAHLLR